MLPWMEERDHNKYRERGSQFTPVAVISLVVALVGVVWILIEYFTDTMRPYAAILVMISLPIFIRSFFQTD